MSSDEEYDYGSDADDGYDYGSDVEMSSGSEKDGDKKVSGSIEIENAFYEGDDVKATDPVAAISHFERCANLEETNYPDAYKYRTKSRLEILRLHAAREDWESVLEAYNVLLNMLHAMTRNEASEIVDDVLRIATKSSSDPRAAMGLYDATLKALESDKSFQKVRARTMLKKATWYKDAKDWTNLAAALDAFQGAFGGDDEDTALEVYSLRIALCEATHQLLQIKAYVEKASKATTAIRDPKLLAVVHEAGGKLLMQQGEYALAYDELFDAFRAHQDSGSPRARTVLMYVFVASIVSRSDINPFDGREARVYREDPGVEAMVALRHAFQDADVVEFERVVKRVSFDDPFFATHLGAMRRSVRRHALVRACVPYKRVPLSLLQSMLLIDDRMELMDVLIDVVSSGELDARIDEDCVVVETHTQDDEETSDRVLDSVTEWSKSLTSGLKAMQTKITVPNTTTAPMSQAAA